MEDRDSPSSNLKNRLEIFVPVLILKPVFCFYIQQKWSLLKKPEASTDLSRYVRRFLSVIITDGMKSLNNIHECISVTGVV